MKPGKSKRKNLTWWCYPWGWCPPRQPTSWPGTWGSSWTPTGLPRRIPSRRWPPPGRASMSAGSSRGRRIFPKRSPRPAGRRPRHRASSSEVRGTMVDPQGVPRAERGQRRSPADRRLHLPLREQHRRGGECPGGKGIRRLAGRTSSSPTRTSTPAPRTRRRRSRRPSRSTTSTG